MKPHKSIEDFKKVLKARQLGGNDWRRTSNFSARKAMAGLKAGNLKGMYALMTSGNQSDWLRVLRDFGQYTPGAAFQGRAQTGRRAYLHEIRDPLKRQAVALMQNGTQADWLNLLNSFGQYDAGAAFQRNSSYSLKRKKAISRLRTTPKGTPEHGYLALQVYTSQADWVQLINEFGQYDYGAGFQRGGGSLHRGVEDLKNAVKSRFD